MRLFGWPSPGSASGPSAPTPAPPASATPSIASRFDALKTQTDAAVDQYRSTGKWIATAAAGAATLVLAGIQLTSIAKVDVSHFWLSVVGVAIALGSAAMVVGGVSRVLVPQVSDRSDAIKDSQRGAFKRWLNKHPSRMASHADVMTFVKSYEVAVAKTPAKRTASEWDVLEAANMLVPLRSFFAARRAFNIYIRISLVAVVFGASGVVLLAWASGQIKNPEISQAIPPAYTAARLHLTRAGAARLELLLGKDCVTAAGSPAGVPVIATKADNQSVTVVIVPGTSCTTPHEVFVPLTDGFAETDQSVTPPAPGSGKSD
jgi:hypothetical protein